MFASMIIDKLRHQLDYEFVAYFFMRSAHPHSAFEVAANLLRQLCVHFHVVPKPLQQFYERSNGEPDHGVKGGGFARSTERGVTGDQ
ncbi:hypothetical protein OEA41_010528 [Lepraria neglecta]|uniref:Uncharacterized protein n=1 Tax=Lepraria neglecta TaxID=209136 RepID=A0AAD9YWS9_9LECA|nr:hypothetical protein OEA41_010528 [Lepraria neglecta]